MGLFPYRDEGGSGGDPVTKTLVGLNVAVFLATALWLPAIILGFGLVPASVAAGDRWETFLTSMFLHAGLAHLVGNMWYLWLFGDNIERRMGHGRFLVIYLASGLAGALAHVLIDPSSTIPMVGASGAISGILGAYLVRFPKAKVDAVVFRRQVRMGAWGVLLVWLALQLVLALLALLGARTPVAFMAHLGGFAMGAALAALLPGRRRWQSKLVMAPRPAAADPGAPTPMGAAPIVVIILLMVSPLVDSALLPREPAPSASSQPDAPCLPDGTGRVTSLFVDAGMYVHDTPVVMIQGLDASGRPHAFTGDVRVSWGSSASERKDQRVEPCDFFDVPAGQCISGATLTPALPQAFESGREYTLTVTLRMGAKTLVAADEFTAR